MAFPIGVRSMYKDNYAFLIASPEKALCDLIANSSNKMDKTIFEDYIKVGKKADSISTLLKFLRR